MDGGSPGQSGVVRPPRVAAKRGFGAMVGGSRGLRHAAGAKPDGVPLPRRYGDGARQRGLRDIMKNFRKTANKLLAKSHINSYKAKYPPLVHGLAQRAFNDVY